MEGTVKWFNRNKGYGFIAGDDGKEYFVHYSAVAQGTFLRDNDKVSFDSDEGERGPIAKNVTLLQKGSERTDIIPDKKAKESAEEVSDEPSEDFGEDSSDEDI